MAFVAALVTRLLVAMACIATLAWIFIVKDAIARHGIGVWLAIVFSMFAIPVGVIGLLVGFIPSWVVFCRTQQREDGVRMTVVGVSSLLILVEAALLLAGPSRG